MDFNNDNLSINASEPRILHVDLSSCFATLEAQCSPLQRGKPLVVAAYDSPGGCVVAPSIEAKQLGIIELRINNGYTQESGLSWKYETKWDFSTIGKKKTPGDCDAGIRQKLSNRSQSLECFTELGSKMGPVLPPRRSSQIKSQALLSNSVAKISNSQKLL
ncbi:MAG TPA: hypothetical protein VE844_10335 [Gammaproteobacteria bacterium]|nr:hypothetical protein [Gammaproteobacteria bacterium]